MSRELKDKIEKIKKLAEELSKRGRDLSWGPGEKKQQEYSVLQASTGIYVFKLLAENQQGFLNEADRERAEEFFSSHFYKECIEPGLQSGEKSFYEQWQVLQGLIQEAQEAQEDVQLQQQTGAKQDQEVEGSEDEGDDGKDPVEEKVGYLTWSFMQATGLSGVEATELVREHLAASQQHSFTR